MVGHWFSMLLGSWLAIGFPPEDWPGAVTGIHQRSSVAHTPLLRQGGPSLRLKPCPNSFVNWAIPSRTVRSITLKIHSIEYTLLFVFRERSRQSCVLTLSRVHFVQISVPYEFLNASFIIT